jgi:hypothetical protein
MDLVRTSVLQIGQLVQNSAKVNGIDAKWKQLRTEQRQTDTPSASLWVDRRYLPAQFTCLQKHTRKWGTNFNRAAWNQCSNMFRKQKKNNAERETEILKISAPPRNRRGHVQLTETCGRWQQITSFRRSGIYVWKMRSLVVKEIPLKPL